jgi:hypothetical protein
MQITPDMNSSFWRAWESPLYRSESPHFVNSPTVRAGGLRRRMRGRIVRRCLGAFGVGIALCAAACGDRPTLAALLATATEAPVRVE